MKDTVTLCKHQKYKLITNIDYPKYSSMAVLIKTTDVTDDIDNYILQFKSEVPDYRFSELSPKEEFGWFYLSRAKIKKARTQPNGAINVYVVPLSDSSRFKALRTCEHEN